MVYPGGLLQGVALLGGHVQITLYLFFALGVFVITLIIREWEESKDIKSVFFIISRLVFVAVIAQVFLPLHIYRQSNLSHLQHSIYTQQTNALYERVGSSLDFASGGSLQWQQLLTILIPNTSACERREIRFCLYGIR